LRPELQAAGGTLALGSRAGTPDPVGDGLGANLATTCPPRPLPALLLAASSYNRCFTPLTIPAHDELIAVGTLLFSQQTARVGSWKPGGTHVNAWQFESGPQALPQSANVPRERKICL
jgi:hypothetical protein